MKKVVLSAFACEPNQGSELGNGWNWAVGLAKQGYEVHCLTRVLTMANIKACTKPNNLFFHYVKMPLRLEKLSSLSQPTMYLHYIIWQWLAYIKAKQLHKTIGFDIAQHVTLGSLQLGSFLYKIPVPFIFGPAGGGQRSPLEFKKYFGLSWATELKREKVSALLLKYNPACKNMIKKAAYICVSNPDTADLVRKQGNSPVHYTLDAALSSDFFPLEFRPKVSQPAKLKLLWVGRFMPRKGILLNLEVMEQLKNFPGISLTVVGDGEQKDDFLNSIQEKGLQNTVFWKGKVSFEEVKALYASHDVFFFVSLRDSCPAQLIEAMAYGMPVVTLNLHGQAIIVSDETGFRCSCNTPDETIKDLTKAILTLYNNPALVTSMSKAAHAFALQQTWDSKINLIIEKCYPV